jgi:DNA primase
VAISINFRELRESLDFADVLAAYGISVEPNATQHEGTCPLPTHQGKKDKPSFSANLPKKLWRCFGCKAGGNVLDFAVRMEGFDPEQGKDVRRAAISLMKRLRREDGGKVLERLLSEARMAYGDRVKALHDSDGVLIGFVTA